MPEEDLFESLLLAIDELIELLEPIDDNLWLKNLKFKKSKWSSPKDVPVKYLLDWLGGKGPFNDYQLPRDKCNDVEQFRMTNSEMQRLQNEIWRILKTINTDGPVAGEVYYGEEALDKVSAMRQMVSHSGNWTKLYFDPVFQNEWILDYPDSELHGGGEPRLRKLERGKNSPV